MIIMKNKILIFILSFTFIFTCCFTSAVAVSYDSDFLPVYPKLEDINASNDILIEIHLTPNLVRKFLIKNIQNKDDISISFSTDVKKINNILSIEKNNNNVIIERYDGWFSSEELTLKVINDSAFNYKFSFNDCIGILVSSNLYNVVDISNLDNSVPFSFYDINEPTTSSTTLSTTIIDDTTVDDTTVDETPDITTNFTRLEHIIIFFGLLFFTMSFVNFNKGSVIDV